MFKGSFHYAKAFGKEANDYMGTDGVHLIASATKLLTTIAVLQCVERGELDLNENIARLLPEWEKPKILTSFDNKNEPIFRLATKTITLRQALHFTSSRTT